ncbi:uncharacterized protein FZC26_26317g5493 [Saccharomyces cerevisiae]|jgi:hypothetical protein|uniref:D-159 protein n=1 Tax=Saccharomyces cerevisiae TaxID=4932 RepID=E9PA56_YEASX|nr:hypothetical protein FZC28_6703g2635 [Saccharomyces cerevisiae]KAJ1532949.1 uncharacterized protein FZC26_26317g5493 [Saccharomyces cerevisiae]GES69066.1 hypothetical protein SCEPF1_0026000100 [Saccharomyces cerevisiae]CAA56027.1 D-159 protein [Saccharomyces cerevisiae]
MWLDPHPKEESFIKSDADEDMFTGAVEKSSLCDGDGECCGGFMLVPIELDVVEDMSRVWLAGRKDTVGGECRSEISELDVGPTGKSLIKSADVDVAVVGLVCIELFDDDDDKFVEAAEVDGKMYSKVLWLYGEDELEVEEVNEGEEFELKYLVENCVWL